MTIGRGILGKKNYVALKHYWSRGIGVEQPMVLGVDNVSAVNSRKNPISQDQPYRDHLSLFEKLSE